MTLRDIHIFLAWVLVATNGLTGLWALAAHWVEGVRGRALWIAVAVAQSLILVQVVIGVIDLNQRGLEVSGIHQFYGFVAAFAVGIIYSYRQQIERWQYLLYGFGGLFLMGMALRTIYIPPLG
jgi:hypothetical protein